jgi:peptide chain release factor subunit 1
MAGTVSWDSLRELAAFQAENGCAISLYLNLDPSITATAGDAHTRVNSLLDAVRSDGVTPRKLGHAQREALKADVERIERFFEQEFNRDGAHGVAVFCAGLDNFWTTLSLTDPVPDEVKVGRDFYLAPLVPLVGRGEGAIVAVVSREQGQLYRLRAGRLERLADYTEEQPGRHDQGGWSQANYQRHIESLVQEHFRRVADELDRQVRRLRGPRVVVVCSEENRAEFSNVLPKSAAAAVVGWAQAEAHATPAQLLAVARPALERWREQEEREAVERWREEAGRNGRAASGWEETLEAASDGRVEILLYENGTERAAWQCPECGRASLRAGNCPLDGTRMEERENGLDLAVHQTLGHGGRVWALARRQDLEPVEGIGALLRY